MKEIFSADTVTKKNIKYAFLLKRYLLSVVISCYQLLSWFVISCYQLLSVVIIVCYQLLSCKYHGFLSCYQKALELLSVVIISSYQLLSVVISCYHHMFFPELFH